MTKNKTALEEKYIQEFKSGWFNEPTEIRFKIGNSQPLESYLEHGRLTLTLENRGAYLLKDKIEDSETAIVCWLAGPNPT